jgi:uncharacterized caspase-like protein
VLVLSEIGPVLLQAGRPENKARRLALVIGNKDYRRTDWVLSNPLNDANAMSEGLTGAGFEVKHVVNATLAEMNDAAQSFATSLHPGDVAVFYYAGHGMQIFGENFLLPVDFSAADEVSARQSAFNVNDLRELLENTPSRLRIIILDTCRTNPFHTSRSLDNSLAAMSYGEGTFIALATGPGATARDGEDRRNGLFTEYLVEALHEPGLDLDQLFSQVRARVTEATKGAQWPHVDSGVVGSFYFHPPPNWREEPPAPQASDVLPLIQHSTIARQVTVSAEDAKQSEGMLVEGERRLSVGRNEDAISLLLRARDLNPNSFQIHKFLGIGYYQSHDWSSAIRELTEALSIQPDSADALRNRGVCLEELGNYKEAEHDLGEAIRLSPSDWQSYWHRGRVRYALGDSKGSEADDLQAKNLRRTGAP